MRHRLVELNPTWIVNKDSGGRVGVRFTCPEHADHEIHVYFALPPDGDQPISMGSAGFAAVFHSGQTFETLSIGQGVDHGEDLMIFIQHGIVFIT